MNWERIAPMESGKGDAGAVVADGKIMVVGGFSGKGFLSSVEIYNPLTNTWQRGPSLQAPRSGMGLAVLHGVVYIAGGNRGTGRLRSVEKLLPGAKRCLNLLNYDSVNNRYMHLEVQCSQMSPHLGTWVPKGTFYSFWVPLGPHFLF